ncbi:MAG: hypothetical protein FJ215_08655 [Ignavibacteria bacterium]|nr:hypothetical protein [Ignavibacteria bacterium]
MNTAFRILIIIILVGSITTLSFAQVADSLRELQRQIHILAGEIERLKLGEVADDRYEPQRGLGPAAARVYQLKKSGVSLAGYGEVVYENYSATRQDGRESKKLDQIDFLRNIIYVGFRYNDWILFNSEIEFEHASTGKTDAKGKSIGEVSVEFAYVELMFTRQLNLRAGMILPPVGIINEKHEPSTFFGALRPQVERSVIPTTWRANGIGVYGELSPSLDYRLYLVEGLNASQFADSDGIRGGRQSGAKALAEDLGLTGKLEYTGVSGLLLGGSFFLGDAGQGMTDSLGSIDAQTRVLSFHTEFVWGGLELRGLYARTDIGDAGRISRLNGKSVGSRLTGWYVVGGYDIMPWIMPGSLQTLAPYVQYERLNTHDAVPSGFVANNAHDITILTTGVGYKPHPNVAFKIDYRDVQNAAQTGVSQWNVALNYLF